MSNLDHFFGPFQPFNPENSELSDAREVAAKKALELRFPEKPSFRHKLNRAVVDFALRRFTSERVRQILQGARVETDPETLAIVHQAWVWADIARDTVRRSQDSPGGVVSRGDNLFIGERDLEDGCSSGLHVVGDGMVSEALMGHVFRDGEDRKNLQYLRRCFGPAVQLPPTAPLALGVFTGEDRQVLGLAQENTLRGVEILRDEKGRFSFQAFPSQRVDLSWVLG